MALICKTCGKDSSSLCDDECFDCHQITTTKWQAKMAIRMNAAQFVTEKIIARLLTHHWMHECEIIRDYMPPYPGPDTRPTCQVRYRYEDGSDTWLRYSHGPLQGFFWDMYGEDFHDPELALIAISQAPPPPRVRVVIPTHGA